MECRLLFKSFKEEILKNLEPMHSRQRYEIFFKKASPIFSKHLHNYSIIKSTSNKNKKEREKKKELTSRRGKKYAQHNNICICKYS